MCLGTVIVTRIGSPPVEIRDVTALGFDRTVASVSTLFGETHRFPGVSIRKIDMQKGVVISLTEDELQ